MIASSAGGEEKEMFRIVMCVIALALCVTLVASSVQAAGLYLYEIGTPDLGLAAAGRAALAQDASTVVGNPAGTLQGDYSSNYVHFVALNVIWKF